MPRHALLRATLMCLAWFPGALNAVPALSLATLYDYLEPHRSSAVKRVENLGEHTAFVKVELAEITFDSAGRAVETLLPGDGLQRALLVTPAQFIVPAKGVRNVRLIFRGQRAAERYFRVRFVPVVPQAGDGFAQQSEEVAAYKAALDAGVRVLKALGGVLVVRPADTRYATEVSANAAGWVLRNQGNATVLMDNLRQCQPEGEACELGRKVHVRPGQHERLPPPARGKQYRFDLIEGTQVKAMQYPDVD